MGIKFVLKSILSAILLLGSSKDNLWEHREPSTQKYFNHADYIVRNNATTWVMAQSDCQQQFRGQGQLLSIDSEAELNFVVEELMTPTDDYTWKNFWTSGTFDPRTNNWKWGNGKSFGDWMGCTWDAVEGYQKQLGPNSRLILNFASQYSEYQHSFFIREADQVERYICEFVPPKINPRIPPYRLLSNKCTSNQDLVIVLDNNLSLNTSSYVKSLLFASELALEWKNEREQNRIGFLVYSSGIRWLFNLDNSIHLDQLQLEVMTALTIPRDSGRSTHRGIQEALFHLTNASSKNDTAKNIIVVTNGKPDMSEKTLEVADKAMAENVRLIAIGVGHSDFGFVGGFNNNTISVGDFDLLQKLVNPVMRKLCPDQN